MSNMGVEKVAGNQAAALKACQRGSKFLLRPAVRKARMASRPWGAQRAVLQRINWSVKVGKKEKESSLWQTSTHSNGGTMKLRLFYSACAGICAMRSVIEIWKNSCKNGVSLSIIRPSIAGFNTTPLNWKSVADPTSKPPWILGVLMKPM